MKLTLSLNQVPTFVDEAYVHQEGAATAPGTLPRSVGCEKWSLAGITNEAQTRMNARPLKKDFAKYHQKYQQFPRYRTFASFLIRELTPGVDHIHHLNAGRGDPVVNDVVQVRHDFTHGRYGLALPVEVRICSDTGNTDSIKT